MVELGYKEECRCKIESVSRDAFSAYGLTVTLFARGLKA
jgi:hypothetical protein